nr:beta-galactosidase 3 [Ipomoea batatas]
MAMKGFTEKIVNLMKSHNLFESQGGPIILSQIENEYGHQAKSLGAAGYQYANWAANMALEMNTGVPWVMCKEEDAPDPVGLYNSSFVDAARFSEFGSPNHERPVQDLAFAVAKFIQKGGLIRQPKYGHLKELHRAVKLCERALVSADPTVTSLGSLQQAYIYSSEMGGCAAFLSNYDTQSAVRVMFNNRHYNLPPWSISILPDCRNVVFNTAKVGVQTSQMEMLPTNSEMFSWETYSEDVFALGDRSSFTSFGLLEQINVTRDTSDYLWYITSVDIGSSESFLHGGELPTLTVQSAGHALLVFINGHLSGSASGTRQNRRFIFNGKVNLNAGTNRIALLSVAVGLPNIGGHFETWNTGILGPVVLHGLDQGKWDLSRAKWTYQVGLKGDALNLGSPNGLSSVEWMQGSLMAQKQQPLTWHKAYFNAPDGDEPLALDMRSMGKGQVWINGQSIGRYWTAYATGNCDGCHYAGGYKPRKCQLGCGQPTQRWYHVPRSWLKPTENLLVLFEELGGDPTRISLVKRSVTSVCADIAEFHPNIKNLQTDSYGRTEEFHKPKLHLRCSPGQSISSITFASFGTPLGTCGNFQQGPCHAPSSHTILEKKCIGRQRCSVAIANSNFGDPCPNVLKRLTVEAVCSPNQWD